MKDRINFLSSLRAGEQRKNRIRQMLLGAAALGVCGIGVQFALLQHETGRLRSETAATEAELGRLKDLRTLEASLIVKKGELLDRRDRLRRLLEAQQGVGASRQDWSGILADLAQSLPLGVWLERLTVQPAHPSAEKGGRGGSGGGGAPDGASRADPRRRLVVSLSGKAFSQEELLDFLADMEHDPRWESATLKKSDREKNNATSMPDLYRFEILLVLAG